MGRRTEEAGREREQVEEMISQLQLDEEKKNAENTEDAKNTKNAEDAADAEEK